MYEENRRGMVIVIIENNWIHFENVGESIKCSLKGVYHTKNKKPYVKLLLEDGRDASLNVADFQTNLVKGRYEVKCTKLIPLEYGSYAYVQFTKLQHESWDKKDELTSTVTETKEDDNKEYDYELSYIMNAIDCAHGVMTSIHDLDEDDGIDKESIKMHMDIVKKELYACFGHLKWR